MDHDETRLGFAIHRVPDRFVDANGDVYMAIRGDFDVTLQAKNIWLTIEATGGTELQWYLVWM